MKLSRICFLCVLACSITISSGALEKMQYKRLQDVPNEKWQELAKKRIYFGHQSVGLNIIEGVKNLINEYPDIKLNIIETKKSVENGGAFMHSRVGENRKPATKIKDFVNIINQELGTVPDAAALKFCYVDVYDQIDENEIFRQYQKAMADLRREHQSLIIIHFTMPLRTQPISWKTKAKLLLGKNPWEFTDNIKRNQFNKLLLAEYQGKEPVFDLAGFEATALDGRKTSFEYQGHKYLAMDPEYSSDGGHLNPKGEEWIATNLLLFLVNTL